MLLQAWQEMAVAVERDGDRAVPRPFHDRLGVGAFGDEEAGVGIPQVLVVLTPRQSQPVRARDGSSFGRSSSGVAELATNRGANSPAMKRGMGTVRARLVLVAPLDTRVPSTAVSVSATRPPLEQVETAHAQRGDLPGAEPTVGGEADECGVCREVVAAGRAGTMGGASAILRQPGGGGHVLTRRRM